MFASFQASALPRREYTALYTMKSPVILPRYDRHVPDQSRPGAAGVLMHGLEMNAAHAGTASALARARKVGGCARLNANASAEAETLNLNISHAAADWPLQIEKGERRWGGREGGGWAGGLGGHGWHHHPVDPAQQP